MTTEEFSKFLNDQAMQHYPEVPEVPAPPKPWTNAQLDTFSSWRGHDERAWSESTFTVPIRTRERVEIPPGALVRANPGVVRKMR